jgi:hypothetical protein
MMLNRIETILASLFNLFSGGKINYNTNGNNNHYH